MRSREISKYLKVFFHQHFILFKLHTQKYKIAQIVHSLPITYTYSNFKPKNEAKCKLCDIKEKRKNISIVGIIGKIE